MFLHILSWLAKHLGGRVFDKLLEKSLRSKLLKVARVWAKSLPEEVCVDPESIFVDPFFNPDELNMTTHTNILRTQVSLNETPSEEVWFNAFLERWNEIKTGAAEPQSFYLLNESQVQQHLHSLARRMFDEWTEDPKNFRRATVDALYSGGDQSASIDAEIENAVHLMEEQKTSEALVLLQRLWSQKNHIMSNRQKYRTKANIGHAYDHLEQQKQAIDCFLEAKQYDPKNEKARAREALAYLYLGNIKRAHELAIALLKDFPEEMIGRTVLLRSSPRELPFEKIEKMVPEHQRQWTDVAMSLGEVAIDRGDYTSAEMYIGQAIKEKPDSPRIKEVLGNLMLRKARIEEQATHDRGPTKEEKEYLTKAEALLSEALKIYKDKKLNEGIVRVLLKRIQVYVGMGNFTDSGKDVSFAYQLDNSNVEVVFCYAGLMSERGDIDTSIDLLSGLLGKGLRPSVECFLSRLLEKRNAEGDKERALDLLKGKLDGLENEDLRFRTEYLAGLVDLERQLHGIDAALRTLSDLPEDLISKESSLVLIGEAYRLEGKTPEAVEAAQKALTSINDNTLLEDKRRIATLLQAVGLLKEALELWKGIVKPSYIGKDTYRLLESADKCEDIKFIIEFCEQLRKYGIWERKAFDLEIFYRETYNDDEGAKKVMQDFIEAPAEPSYVPHVRTLLSVLGIRTSQNELIEDDPTKLPSVTGVEAPIGRFVAYVLRYGKEPIKAVEYAYELLRLNQNHKDAHMAMIGTMLPHGPTIKIEEPKVVTPGVAVKYEENDTGQIRWHIIEDSEVCVPNLDWCEFPVDHPVSCDLLGKKCGDQFYLQKDNIQNRTATIKQLVSKYVYRFNVCMQQFGARFPGGEVIKTVFFKEQGGKIDFTVLDKMAEQDAQLTQKIEDLYLNKLVPLHFVAHVKGSTVFEAMHHVASKPDLNLKCCTGTDEELAIAQAAMEDAENLVIDVTAIVTLLLCQTYENLVHIPQQLVISEGILDELRATLTFYANPESLAGFYGKDGLVVCSPEEIKKIKERLQALLDFLQKCCTVESGLIVAELEVDRREYLIRFFGQSGLESMMLASRNKNALWTDDFAVAEVARTEFKCQRVWTQSVFEHSSREGLFEPALVTDVVLKLIQMGYYYTRPNVDILLRAADKADQDVDKPPLLQALDWFADPNVKLPGLIDIGAMFLKAHWQENHIENVSQAVTIRVLERLSARPGGFDVIKKWLQDIHVIFRFDVVNAAKMKNVIIAWLAGRGRRIIIP